VKGLTKEKTMKNLKYIADEEIARMRDAARMELVAALNAEYGMALVEEVTGGLDED
jgi:hypothetical protein